MQAQHSWVPFYTWMVHRSVLSGLKWSGTRTGLKWVKEQPMSKGWELLHKATLKINKNLSLNKYNSSYFIGKLLILSGCTPRALHTCPVSDLPSVMSSFFNVPLRKWYFQSNKQTGQSFSSGHQQRESFNSPLMSLPFPSLWISLSNQWPES